jgi:hypothetical protein
MGRTRMTRGTATSKYRARDRDVSYMLWIKQQVCCARGLSGCDGAIEADHAGRRGVGRKADDRTCISLCTLHHVQRGSFSGPFRTWNQAMMRVWLESHIRVYQDKYERMLKMQAQNQPKRFFRFEDGPALYYAVARDLDHAKNMLMDAGIEWGDPSSTTPPEPVELSHESAGKVRCDMSEVEDVPGRKQPLTECKIGEWFSTEY